MGIRAYNVTEAIVPLDYALVLAVHTMRVRQLLLQHLAAGAPYPK